MIKFDLNLKKLGPRAVMIAAISAAGLAILGLYFILRPQIVTIADLADKIGKVSGELKAAKNDISGIAKLKEDIKSYEAKVEIYEKRLPAEKEIPKLLESLSETARKSNVSIVGITPAQASANKPEGSRKTQIYQEVPILISAKCGYHELGAFLASLESEGRFMKIANIGIRANKATPMKHDVELLVCTYVLLEEK